MKIPTLTEPPKSRSSYVISQLDGEKLTIPGSKGTFRILASSAQTDGKISVFQSGAVLSDAPGFHYHNEAHDVFIVTKGFLKLWNGDKCRVLGPGDFAYVPPKIVHNPELLGPHTETFGLVAPGDWIDFFRYVGETFEGLVVPEKDDRDLKGHIIPKMMKAPKDFDVHFMRHYQPPAVSDWEESENTLPGELQPYFLRSNTGPRWIAGGVLSRPFITCAQSGGRFAISSIESSSTYGRTLLSRYIIFSSVDHCLSIQEGALKVAMKDDSVGVEEWTTVREGETVMIAAGQAFKLEAGSKFVRVWSFANGKGIEEIVEKAGAPFDGYVIPDTVGEVDETKFKTVIADLSVQLG